MKVSLIIAYYKNILALSLIFKALDCQSYKDFEIIVAEDDNEMQTVEFVKVERGRHDFVIKHLRQKEDNGFRKNEMLNKALADAEGEFIVFLDGDTIPHKHLVMEYAKSLREGVALFGRRVMLSEKLTNKILASGNLSLLNFPELVFSGSGKLKYAVYLPFVKSFRETGIWGCNWGIMKKHLLAVNGFDEDYVKAGYGEDVDIEWRLKNNGIRLLSVRFGAIVYHLHHKANYSEEDLRFNFILMEKKKRERTVRCKNGLVKE